ncbi:hypothetical protein Tco_0676300 [Tanacetum coccineum]
MPSVFGWDHMIGKYDEGPRAKREGDGFKRLTDLRGLELQFIAYKEEALAFTRLILVLDQLFIEAVRIAPLELLKPVVLAKACKSHFTFSVL